MTLNKERLMIRHKIGLPLLLISSLVGLWSFLLIGSLLRWIEPVWWGGEALFTVVAGSIYVPLSALFFYVIAIKTLKLKNRLNEFSYRLLVIAGILVGFLFYPCMFITTYVIKIIPAWEKIDLMVAVHLGAAMTGLFSIIISFLLLYVIWFWRGQIMKRKVVRSL